MPSFIDEYVYMVLPNTKNNIFIYFSRLFAQNPRTFSWKTITTIHLHFVHKTSAANIFIERKCSSLAHTYTNTYAYITRRMGNIFIFIAAWVFEPSFHCCNLFYYHSHFFSFPYCSLSHSLCSLFDFRFFFLKEICARTRRKIINWNV